MKGILLTNIGSPDDCSPKAVRRYLKNFLSDERVVEIPKWLWLPILYGWILPIRSRASAKLYQTIWQQEGSPLLIHCKNIAKKLQEQLQCPVVLGMHYGHPSIAEGLSTLRAQGVNEITILPMFPQYSATTTASSFDFVASVLKTWRVLPALHFVRSYATHQNYIHALCESIKNTWQTHGRAHLLFSFHGIPERYVQLGDCYRDECHATVKSIAEKLELKQNEYSISFQSRLGRAAWLQPYTDQVLKKLPQQGITNLQVICPGFSVDCLETLEEINVRGREEFLSHGGKTFHYIPALNDHDHHITLLQELVS